MRYLLLIVLVVPFACATPRNPVAREAAFGPAELRINQTFTRMRDTNGDDTPDRVEANIELIDAYGDATKGSGIVSFDLFEYATGGTDVQGPRVGSPQLYDLGTSEQQSEHWQSVVRTYRFRLPWTELDGEQRYVLSAVYRPSANETETGEQSQRRLYDRLIVGG